MIFFRRYNRQYGGIASQKRYVPEKCNNISYDRGCFMYCFLEDDRSTGDRCSHKNGYSNLLLQHEMDEEFKRLLLQTSKLDGEMYIIDKNIGEMENVMKQTYRLYKELEADEQVPPHFKKEALSIARLIHEIKGDYKGVAEVIRTQLMYEPDSGGMKISDIFSLEKKDAGDCPEEQEDRCGDSN